MVGGIERSPSFEVANNGGERGKQEALKTCEARRKKTHLNRPPPNLTVMCSFALGGSTANAGGSTAKEAGGSTAIAGGSTARYCPTVTLAKNNLPVVPLELEVVPPGC